MNDVSALYQRRRQHHSNQWMAAIAYWRLPMTLSTRNLVEAGSTRPETRLITISTNPRASSPRRGLDQLPDFRQGPEDFGLSSPASSLAPFIRVKLFGFIKSTSLRFESHQAAYTHRVPESPLAFHRLRCTATYTQSDANVAIQHSRRTRK